MSSDSTGEIFVVTKEDGSGVADVSDVAGSATATASASSGQSPVPNVASVVLGRWSGMYWVAVAVIMSVLV